MFKTGDRSFFVDEIEHEIAGRFAEAGIDRGAAFDMVMTVGGDQIYRAATIHRAPRDASARQAVASKIIVDLQSHVEVREHLPAATMKDQRARTIGSDDLTAVRGEDKRSIGTF